jgi:hypothetical protein
VESVLGFAMRKSYARHAVRLVVHFRIFCVLASSRKHSLRVGRREQVKYRTHADDTGLLFSGM